MPNYSGSGYSSDFLKFWAGQTLGVLCANVTSLSLPILAAISLDASAFQMGLLGMAGSLPSLLLSLLAGLVVDRWYRRRVLVISGLVRGTVLLVIPLASLFGSLELWHLYVVSLLTGACATFADVADNAYLPTLVGLRHLVAANSKLTASTAAAGAIGPGVAGGLIQLLTAPVAILVDAVASVISACILMAIRIGEPTREPQGPDRWWRQAGLGLHLLWRDLVLRSFATSSMVYLLSSSMVFAVYVLFSTETLAIAPGTLGVIFGVGGLGAVIGAVLAEPAVRALGAGKAMIVINLFGGLSMLILPWVERGAAAAPLLMAAQFGSQCMGAAFAIIQTSMRQSRTPDQALGRMSASYQFLTLGSVPLGMLIGGILGEMIGLRGTVLLGGIGMLLPTIILYCSPVRGIRKVSGVETLSERLA
jgi:predicted MFS family arabinose efflux permease